MHLRMVPSLLCLFLVMGILKGEYFDRWTRTCENSAPAISVEVDGLIQCAVRCNSVNYCKTFSFIRETDVCNLYSLEAPCCNDSTTGNSLLFRMRAKACEFTSVHLQTTILTAQCGASFLNEPMIFRIKGTGQANIFLFGNNAAQYSITFENTSLNRNLLDLTYSNIPHSSNIQKHGWVFDQDTWIYYWVAFPRFQNGTTTVELGQGEMPGCNILLQKYDGINFLPSSALLDQYEPGSELFWTFYGYD